MLDSTILLALSGKSMELEFFFSSSISSTFFSTAYFLISSYSKASFAAASSIFSFLQTS